MMTKPTCKCRRGKASGIDGKCGHCRSRKEQQEVDRKRVMHVCTDNCPICTALKIAQKV